MNRRAMKAAAGALLLVAIAQPATAAKAADTQQSVMQQRADATCPREPQYVAPITDSYRHPVVLVHGWTGSPSAMTPVEEALEDAIPGRLVNYSYDFASGAAPGAATPEVAGCLAVFIDAVSAVSQAAGGDGKVFVVAHSMGGLAIRYASALSVGGRAVGDELGRVVTIDTPHLGSYWGGSIYADLKARFSQLSSLFSFPEPADAATCLARFGEIGSAGTSQNPFPAGCGKPAPYLPATVPLQIVRGLVSVQRTIFGIPVYTFSLDGDGVVDTTSQGLYAGSGPAGGTAGPYAVTDVSCTVTAEALKAIVDSRSPQLAPLVIGALAMTDSTAINDVLAGRASAGSLLALAASQAAAPCGHGPILSHPEAHQAVISALQGWLATSLPQSCITRSLANSQALRLVREAGGANDLGFTPSDVLSAALTGPDYQGWGGPDTNAARIKCIDEWALVEGFWISYDNTYIDSNGRVYNRTRENPAKVLLRWDGTNWTGVSLVLLPVDCCEVAGTHQAECQKAPAEFRAKLNC